MIWGKGKWNLSDGGAAAGAYARMQIRSFTAHIRTVEINGVAQ